MPLCASSNVLIVFIVLRVWVFSLQSSNQKTDESRVILGIVTFQVDRSSLRLHLKYKLHQIHLSTVAGM